LGKSIEPLVGANWDNGSFAGVFARNLNNASSNSNNNVGGSDSFAMAQTPMEKVQNRDRLSSVSKQGKPVNFSSASENLCRLTLRKL